MKKLKLENSTKKQEKATMDKGIQDLVNKLNKKYGTNAVRLGVEESEGTIIRIPTSNVSLDIDLGGGIPVGRVTQISGAFSSTKTTQTMHVVKNALDMGMTVCFQDAEGTSSTEDGLPDFNYFEKFGITREYFEQGKILFARPDSLEECTEMLLDVQKSGLVQLGVIDSIAMLEPNKVLDSAMEDTVQMGVKQKLLGEYFAKYQLSNNKLVREGKQPFTLVCINQLREKIGAYGDPEYTPGGRALGYTLSVDLRLRQGDLISNSDKEVVGQVVKYKISKNKTYMRLKSGEFDIYLDENENGIQPFHTDNIKSIIVEGVAHGFIERGGAWYFLDRDNGLKFQGLDNLVDYIRQNPEWIDKIKNQVLAMGKEHENKDN